VKPDIAVVIPTYNERDTITTILDAVRARLPDADILVVDDSSPDGTADIVADRGRLDERISLLLRDAKEGLGAAYFAGFRRLLDSGYRRIVQMDADFSHDPAYLPTMVAELDAGADLVIGSRYVTGGGTLDWPLFRRLTSRGGSLYAALILGLPVRDVTGGFKAWSAPLLRAAIKHELALAGFGFQIEMTYRARLLGAEIREIPIIFPDRREGQSKMSRSILVEALVGVWRLRQAGRRLIE